MTATEKRVLIYTALAFVCAIAAAFVGLGDSLMTFFMIAVVIEGLLWFGLPRLRPSPHRQHRTLFN